MALNWVPRLKYTQAETDTHRYRVTYKSFESAALSIWEFDDNAPYGRRLVHTSDHGLFTRAQRTAENFATHR